MLRRSLPVVALFALVAAGCSQDDGVRKYSGTKPVEPAGKPDVAAPAAGGEYRILGAVFPEDNPVWFFKLAGSAAGVAEQEPKFDEFVKSIRFPNGTRNEPLWDRPAGWRDGPPKSMRLATILVGSQDKPMELSVSQAGGGMQANVDRWAGQLGVPGGKADLKAATKDVTTATGAKGLRVDLKGPKDPAAGGMPPFMGGR